MATAVTFSNRSEALPHTSSLAGPIVLLGRLFFALIFLMAAPNHFKAQTIA